MDDAVDNWLRWDLQDRRYITVVEDADARPDEAEDQKGVSIGESDLPRLLPFAPLALPLLPLTLSLAAPLALGALAMGWLRRQQKAAVTILPVPRKFVGGVDFGPSGWEPDTVYAANPKQPTMYCALATFHDQFADPQDCRAGASA